MTYTHRQGRIYDSCSTSPMTAADCLNVARYHKANGEALALLELQTAIFHAAVWLREHRSNVVQFRNFKGAKHG
jgi:hypothetical protein